MLEDSSATQDPANPGILVQPEPKPDPPEPVTAELALEPDSPADGDVAAEHRISRSEARRQQEHRSLP